MRHVRTFARFWWDFIIGDDWRVALGIAVSLAVTWGVTSGGADPWWLLPLAIFFVLAGSLWLTTRRSS